MYIANLLLPFLPSLWFILLYLHCKYWVLIVLPKAFRSQRSSALKSICQQSNWLLFLFPWRMYFNMLSHFFLSEQINYLSMFKSFFRFHASSCRKLAFFFPTPYFTFTAKVGKQQILLDGTVGGYWRHILSCFYLRLLIGVYRKFRSTTRLVLGYL